jgi:hypothetical protein
MRLILAQPDLIQQTIDSEYSRIVPTTRDESVIDARVYVTKPAKSFEDLEKIPQSETVYIHSWDEAKKIAKKIHEVTSPTRINRIIFFSLCDIYRMAFDHFYEEYGHKDTMAMYLHYSQAMRLFLKQINNPLFRVIAMAEASFQESCSGEGLKHTLHVEGKKVASHVLDSFEIINTLDFDKNDATGPYPSRGVFLFSNDDGNHGFIVK